MRHSPNIRAARPDDAKRLSVLAVQVWLHTYATDGINDAMAQYVLSELTLEKFSALLSHPDVSIFVAEHDAGMVGFSVVRSGTACPVGSGSTVELQTLYVQAHFIGRGVGRSLLKAAEALARKRFATPLWLTVNAQNARAIAFYARQGYQKVGTTFFALGESRHENHVLVGGDAPLER